MRRKVHNRTIRHLETNFYLEADDFGLTVDRKTLDLLRLHLICIKYVEGLKGE